MRFLQREVHGAARATAAASCRRSTACPAAREGGRPVDWFYYVNGIEADQRRRGDASCTPATGCGGTTTTGAPRSGVPGRRRLVPRAVRVGRRGQAPAGPDRLRRRRGRRVRRGPSRGSAAVGVKIAASRRSAPAAGRRCCASSSGRGRALRADRRRPAHRAGPRRRAACSPPSRATGAALTVLDDRGARRRPLGAGGGLVAATRLREQQPTWVVTGTDAAGLGRARALCGRTCCATASRWPSRVELASRAGRGPRGRCRDLPPARHAAARRPRGGRRRLLRRAGHGRRSSRAARSCSSPPSSPSWPPAPPPASGASCAARPGSRFPSACSSRLINPIVDHNGLTVVARLGTVPWLGELDITLEAVVYGAHARAARRRPDRGLRALLGGRRSRRGAAAVRRVSYRSALTASLATRMVPVLARDARRMADAQRCRPARPAPAARAGARASPAGRWTGPSTWRPRWRCAATARRGARRAIRRAVVAPRLRLRRRRRRPRRAGRRRGPRRRGGLRSVPGAAGRRGPGRGAAAAAALVVAARWRRSPTAQGDRAGERAARRALTYRYPGAAEPALRDVSLSVEEGELVVLCGLSGSGSRRCCAPRAAWCPLPRRRVRRARRHRRPGHARPRAGRARRGLRARCSRIPRRRW